MEATDRQCERQFEGANVTFTAGWHQFWATQKPFSTQSSVRLAQRELAGPAELNHWNPAGKAVVLDGRKCSWSRHIIGLPSVVKVGNRLAVLYDGNAAAQMPRGVKSRMNRDVGLAWLELPLTAPISK